MTDGKVVSAVKGDGDRDLAFSIDFEGFVEGMEESFAIPTALPRFQIGDELARNADRCLELFASHGVQATFFVLGWIAGEFPALVRSVAAAGHELGSHSLHHRRLWGLTAAEAGAAIVDSKKAIEDAVGSSVVGFRAPDCSLQEGSPLFDTLAGAGYLYDSSINPTNVHDVYGSPVRRVEIWRTPSGIVELPIPTVLLAGRYSVTVGSGGYFRIFPYALTRRWLRQAPARVTYLHPYEVGGVFPRDHGGSVLRRFRHTYSCGKLDDRLARLFSDFRAMSVAEYLRQRGFLD